jgi:hypothetical protein
MLTEEYRSKKKKKNASFEDLCCCQDEGHSFMESIITGDETGVYEFTPE